MKSYTLVFEGRDTGLSVDLPELPIGSTFTVPVPVLMTDETIPQKVRVVSYHYDSYTSITYVDTMSNTPKLPALGV